MDKPIVPVPPHIFKLAQEVGFKDSHFDIVEDKPVVDGSHFRPVTTNDLVKLTTEPINDIAGVNFFESKNHLQKCPDCLAYYNGAHTCPPWLKAIVTKNKKRKCFWKFAQSVKHQKPKLILVFTTMLLTASLWRKGGVFAKNV